MPRQRQSMASSRSSLATGRGDAYKFDRVRTPSAWNWRSQITHDRIASVVLDVNMDMRDQVVLNKILKENSDQAIRRGLTKKFNLYYALWIDFCVLTCGLSLAGLILGLYEWEV